MKDKHSPELPLTPLPEKGSPRKVEKYRKQPFQTSGTGQRQTVIPEKKGNRWGAVYHDQGFLLEAIPRPSPPFQTEVLRGQGV